MKKIKQIKQRTIIIFILIELVITALAVAGAFSGDRYEKQFLQEEIPTWENAICLLKGSYVVELSYETAEENAWCRPMMECSSGMQSGEKVLLPAYAQEKTFEVRVRESTERFYFDSNLLPEGTLVITKVTIHETNQADIARGISLITLFFFLDVLFLMWQRNVFDRMNVKERNVAFGLLGTCFVSSLPLFVDYMVTGHDFEFHMMRIEGLAKGLMSGQFPVKLQPGWLNGYGYPVSIMYGDLLLYLPALLRVGGFTLQTSYKIYVIFINAITVITSYFCVKKISGDRKGIGLFGSVLYTLSIYRLVNVYTRCAVGEYTAMAFLPLVFLGLHRILCTDEKRQGSLDIILGYSFLLESHLLSFEMAVIFSAIYCLLQWKSFSKEMGGIVKSAVITVFLNLGFLVPFADYLLHQDLWIKSGETGNMQSHGLFLPQLFQIFGSTGGGSSEASSGIQGDMLIGPGVLVILAVILFVWQRMVYGKQIRKQVKETEWREQNVLFLILVLALCMSCVFFPWSLLNNIPIMGKYLCSYQFAWRFLAMAEVFFVVLMSYLFDNMSLLFGSGVHKKIMVWLSVFAVLQALCFINEKMVESESVMVTDTACIHSVNAISGGEYLVQGMLIDHVIEDDIKHGDHVTVENWKRNENHFTVTMTNHAKEEDYVSVPLFAYKGYQAVDMSTGAELSVVRDDFGALQVVLPVQYQGTIEIYFRERTIWRIAELLSLITLIGGVAVCIKYRVCG